MNQAFFLFIIFTLSGCGATTPAISVKPSWDNNTRIVGIISTNIPPASAYKNDKYNQLSPSVNSQPNDLEQHLQNLQPPDITSITDKISRYLKSKGMHVKRLSSHQVLQQLRKMDAKAGNGSKADYRPLKLIHGIDKLIVIRVEHIGSIRPYYGFVPLAEPKGFSHLSGYMINLDNNQHEWKHSVMQQVECTPAAADPAAEFAGLKKAVHMAFDQSKNSLFEHFSQ
ncbi:MAG: hypothetical protein OEY29_04970 [Gammaproteobacteria bacterium]|nr:hypothetical protein [Gammaproteobacteria bacterium]